MPTDPSPFGNVKRAYELLGVPESATTHAIKHAYRVMAKRWHPDLYRAGTPEQAEATQMMELINRAYSQIQRAPLRYDSPEGASVTPQSANPTSRPVSGIPIMRDEEPVFGMDRFEFWVRFVCGAILGIFISAGFALRTSFHFIELSPALVVCISIAIVLGCGFGAARGGDNFWYGFFGVKR
jgi:curved DNA-binding protein CbpA